MGGTSRMRIRPVTSVTWRTASPTRPFVVRLRNLVQRGRQAEGGLGRRAQPTPRTEDGRLGAGRRGQEGPQRQERQASAHDAEQERQAQEGPHPRRQDPPGAALRAADRPGRRLLVAGAGFAYLYKTTKLPNPNADFETNTSFVYYNDGETELGRYAVQNRDAISYDEMPQDVKDAVVAAENRTFWSDSGIDYKGIVRAVFNNASGQRHPGRVDDHPAVHQDPLPHPGALLHPQAEGGDPLPQAGSAGEQAGDPRGLPQHHLLRARRLRDPGRRHRLLRQAGRRALASRRARRWRASSTTRTTSTRPTARTPRSRCGSATPTSSTAWPRPTTSLPTRRRRPPSGCPSSTRRRPRAPTAGRRATS